MFGLATTIVAFVCGVVFAVPVTAWWKNKSAAAAASAAGFAEKGVTAVIDQAKKSL